MTRFKCAEHSFPLSTPDMPIPVVPRIVCFGSRFRLLNIDFAQWNDNPWVGTIAPDRMPTHLLFWIVSVALAVPISAE
jgi:hypothetical protein